MDHEDMTRDLFHRLTLGYRRMAKVLARLDIPITLRELETVDGVEFLDMEHYDSIALALDLIEDAPMGRLLRAALRTACLDWLSAIAISALANEEAPEVRGPDWTYMAPILHSTRVMLSLDAATRLLDEGEPDRES